MSRVCVPEITDRPIHFLYPCDHAGVSPMEKVMTATLEKLVIAGEGFSVERMIDTERNVGRNPFESR